MDPSGFVLLSDFVPDIIQEIRMKPYDITTGHGPQRIWSDRLRMVAFYSPGRAVS